MGNYISQAWDWTMNVSLTNMAGVFLFWMPILICAIGFTIEIIVQYRKDRENRAKRGYRPVLTIGYIVEDILISLCPILNLGWALFYFSVRFKRRFLEQLGFIFTVPLVRAQPLTDKEYDKAQTNVEKWNKG